MKFNLRTVKLFLVGLVLLGLFLSPQWAEAQGKAKIKLAQVIPALSFAPTYIAMDKGLFAEEGIDVDFQLVRGTAGGAAITGGDVDFCACSGSELLNLAVAKLAVLGVAGIATTMTMNIFVNNAFLSRTGVTPNSPLKERVRALKGAKMGVTSLGGAPDLYARWLMSKFGMNPKKDINIIAIGIPPVLRTAALKGAIDGFMLSPPLAQAMEMKNQGRVLIYGHEIAEFKDFIHEVLIVRKKYVAENPKIAAKVVRAMGRANNFIQDHSEEAKKLLQKRFKRVTPKAISTGVDLLKGAFGRDGRMTETSWKNAITVNLSWRNVKTPDPKEGSWWTNRYIK